MKLTTIGIDLAKNVFQIHGVDQHGKTVLKKQRKRDQMASFFANTPICLVGMEACGGAHHWGRKLQGFGHTVKLIAPQFACRSLGSGLNTVLLDVFFINFPLRNRKRPKQRNRDVHRHVARCAVRLDCGCHRVSFVASKCVDFAGPRYARTCIFPAC